MSSNKKVRVQLLDESTGAVVDEVDVITSADSVLFDDGETFQQKLNSGKLKGQNGTSGLQGPKGDKGDIGPQGPKGDSGDNGETVRVGKDYVTGSPVKLFLKTV